jgi:hypothetical protein
VDNRPIPLLSSEVYDSDLAAEDGTAEPEAVVDNDGDENLFWDNMIFPI